MVLLTGSWTIFGVDIRQLSICNLLKLAFVVVGVFAISFGPFVYMVGVFSFGISEISCLTYQAGQKL